MNSGAATAVELDRQGKQIDNIHENLVTIQKDVKQSERHVRGTKLVTTALTFDTIKYLAHYKVQGTFFLVIFLVT